MPAGSRRYVPMEARVTYGLLFFSFLPPRSPRLCGEILWLRLGCSVFICGFAHTPGWLSERRRGPEAICSGPRRFHTPRQACRFPTALLPRAPEGSRPIDERPAGCCEARRPGRRRVQTTDILLCIRIPATAIRI